MRRQGWAAKALGWLVIWVVFTVAMRFITDFAGIYRGWRPTALAAALVVTFWCVALWLRSCRQRNAALR